MKAILWTKYGPPEVLKLKDVEKPVPGDNEVLIKIHATTVTAGDCEMRRLKLPLLLWVPIRIYVGLRKPVRITTLGMELAGKIESAGKNVTRFRPGDRVFGTSGFRMGTHAEYICLPAVPKQTEGALAKMTSGMSYPEAAAVSIGGLEARYFLEQANLRKGQKVLINGAGGSIGTFAVQIAKSLGAEVTGVDRQSKLDMLLSIGADHVIDYTREDFTKNGVTYDVIFDVMGKTPFLRSLRSLKKNGVYLIGNARLSQMLGGLLFSKVSGRKVIFGTASHTVEELESLARLIQAGRIKTVIDRSYPLEQIVEANRYVESGQKKGNVIISLIHPAGL